MTTALPLNPINTINTTDNAPVAKTITITPPHSNEQHHQTFDSKTTHESEHPVDYVHSLVDMTVHTIDSIWPATQLHPNSTTTDENSTNATTTKVVDTRTFIKHILRNSRTRHSTLLISIFYLFRIKPRLFKALQVLPTEERRYLLCGRRMFLVALTLAWKYQEDRSPGSKFWSKVSGLPVAQITQAERLFLGLLDYQLHIPKDSYDQWAVLVQRHCGKPHGLVALPDDPSYPVQSSSVSSALQSPPPEGPVPEQRHPESNKRRRYATSAHQYHAGNPTALLPLPTPPTDAFGDSPLKRKWSST